MRIRLNSTTLTIKLKIKHISTAYENCDESAWLIWHVWLSPCTFGKIAPAYRTTPPAPRHESDSPDHLNGINFCLWLSPVLSTFWRNFI